VGRWFCKTDYVDLLDVPIKLDRYTIIWDGQSSVLDSKHDPSLPITRLDWRGGSSIPRFGGDSIFRLYRNMGVHRQLSLPNSYR
jgi:hypothetical protein